MKGLVLAGGHGTRLRPLTFTGNKHMIPVANQPILFYALRNLAQAGVRDVAIVLGTISEGIREAVGDGRDFGLSVEYVLQGEPKGLAHAVLCAHEFLQDDPFVMYLGDNLLQSGVSPYLKRFDSSAPDAVVGVTHVARPEHYGVIELSGDEIVSIEEKPAQPKSDLALIGVYLFTRSIRTIIEGLRPSRRGELEITEAIWGLSQSGHRVSVLEVDGWWKDTGHPSDLLEANELVLHNLPPESFVMEGAVRAGAIVDGRVSVGTGSIIESGAHVIGPTVIGSNVRIESGSRVGPSCALGNGVVVNRASVRRSIVLDGALIDGIAIADSLVGRNVQILSSRPPDREVTLTLGDSSRIAL